MVRTDFLRVKFHRRTHSVTLLQKPICTANDYRKSYGTFMSLKVVNESGNEVIKLLYNQVIV